MHCMNADLSDLLRLLQNLIRLGTIAEVKGAKARVRLGPTLTTEWLKWATRRAGSTHTWSAPTVGEHVIVSSPRYAANSASFSGAASSTTANLSAELHCSGFCPSPGTARPCSRACLRHRYSVASGTPVSCATAATGLLYGALIWLSACSFFSLVYFVIVKSIAPGQIRTPIAGGDNYFDRVRYSDINGHFHLINLSKGVKT